MRNELDDLLCQRYPLIFAERQLSEGESCMERGFACDDGWFDLIDTLCMELQQQTDQNKAPQLVCKQVKEKFGELRFGVRGATDIQRGMVMLASAMSTRICEECGASGRLVINGGCWMCRCPTHTPDGAKPAPDEMPGLIGLAAAARG